MSEATTEKGLIEYCGCYRCNQAEERRIRREVAKLER